MSSSLLNLPTELRLMIFERIPVVTRQHRILLWKGDQLDPTPGSTELTIITRSIPVSLLLTCRLIYRNALPILQDKVLREPPRMIINSLVVLATARGILLGDRNFQTGFLDRIIFEIGCIRSALDHGILSMPPLTGVGLCHRLGAGGYSEASELMASELAVLSSFIYHAAYYIRLDNEAKLGIEVGIQPCGVHLRSNPTGFPGAVHLLYASLQSACSRNQVRASIKILLPASVVGEGPLRIALEDSFHRAFHATTMRRLPTDEENPWVRVYKETASVVVDEEAWRLEWMTNKSL